MWLTGVAVEQETSAPPPKKLQDPPLEGLVNQYSHNNMNSSVKLMTDDKLLKEDADTK